jgi:hypothetical protein
MVNEVPARDNRVTTYQFSMEALMQADGIRAVFCAIIGVWRGRTRHGIKAAIAVTDALLEYAIEGSAEPSTDFVGAY